MSDFKIERYLRSFDFSNIDLKQIEYDYFEKFLFAINYHLRTEDDKEKGMYNGLTMVGDYVAPNKESKRNFLKQTFNVIKDMSDRDNQSLLAYYMLINLHLFKDGNGRTARLIYRILSEKKFNIESFIEEYKHDENNLKVNKGNFEEKIGIIKISELNNIITELILKKLIEQGKLPDDIRINKKYIKIYTNGEKHDFNSLYINSHIIKNLSPKEIRNINIVFLDNESDISISALALAVHLYSENKLEKWILLNEEEIDFVSDEYKDMKQNELIFDLGKERNHDLMDEWNLSDYYDTIKLRDEFKDYFLVTLIDIFNNPESYILENNLLVANYLKNKIDGKRR